MKVALCTPVYDQPKALFTMSALALVTHEMRARPDLDLHTQMLINNSRIDRAREIIASKVMDRGVDWLLWLDADQTFPKDTLSRLLAHNLPMVGAQCRKKHGAGTSAHVKPRPEGVEQVDFIGFGVVLTSAAMYRRMPRPWFRFTDTLSEDGYFCEQAIKAGYRPHVDHALSMEVGHIAETVLYLR